MRTREPGGAACDPELHWNDATGLLTHVGASAWTNPESAIVKIVGR
jgi:hypothetical protein